QLRKLSHTRPGSLLQSPTGPALRVLRSGCCGTSGRSLLVPLGFGPRFLRFNLCAASGTSIPFSPPASPASGSQPHPYPSPVISVSSSGPSASTSPLSDLLFFSTVSPSSVVSSGSLDSCSCGFRFLPSALGSLSKSVISSWCTCHLVTFTGSASG